MVARRIGVRLLVVAGLAAGCGAAGHDARPARSAARPARPPAAGVPPPPLRRVLTLGRSTGGRPIRLVELGDPQAAHAVLVVGCIHGTECQGEHVTERLSHARPPRGVRLLIVSDLNPDGHAAGVRGNGRGVDLNRNFPSEWRPIGVRRDPQYAGPRPLSEPETRLAVRLVARERPTISIWYHQPQAVVRAWGHSIAAARRYARLARAPFRRLRWPSGTASNWQNHRFASAASFVVELAAGPLSPALARRHASAVRALAATLSRGG